MSAVAPLDREELGKRELIGDALVQLFAREHLRAHYPEVPKHRFDAVCVMLVCNETLDAFAVQRGIEPIDDTPKGLARAYEIRIATIYLEQGLARARQFFVRSVEQRFDIAASAATWHRRSGITPVLAASELPRVCEMCGEPYNRRRTETTKQFFERRFCSVSCSAKRERPIGRKQRPRELVKCAVCSGMFEATPSRIERSRSGLLYCSRECQAEHRQRGAPLHHQEEGPLRIAVAADARTGRYSLHELAERHASPEGTIAAILHREGIRLMEIRNGASEAG